MNPTKKKASAGHAGQNGKQASATSVAHPAPKNGAAPLCGLSVNLQRAQRFLRALTGEDQPVVTFQTFDDNDKRKAAPLAKVLHGSLDQHAAALAALNQRGAGVFV